MPRRALIVEGAAGSDSTAADNLPLRDFGRPIVAPSIDAAITLIQREHIDLLLVPLADMQPLQLQALERVLRRSESTFVIGTATKADPELMLRGFRSGIHEFLQLPFKPEDLLQAIDRQLHRGQAGQGEGTVIAVYSAKGGVGATTIAVNLAHAFALSKPEHGAVLGDLVSGSGDIRVHLNLTPAYDRGDLVQKIASLDTELFRSIAMESVDGLWVLPGPDVLDLNGVLDEPTTAAIVRQMREDFDFSIIDCEHHIGYESTVAVLSAADHILVVTDLSLAAIRNTQRALLMVRRLGLSEDKLRIVVNRNQSSEILSSVDAQAAFKRDIFWKLPNDYRTAAGALAKGVPIARYDPKSKLAVSFRQLAEQLTGASAGASRNGSGPGHSRMAQLFSRATKRS